MTLQIGNAKVFLRAGQMAELDARRVEVQGNAIKIIQRRIRTHIARRQYVALRVATIQAQSLWRGESIRKCLKHETSTYYLSVYGNIDIFSPIFQLMMWYNLNKIAPFFLTISRRY